MTSPYEDALWKELAANHAEALADGRLQPPPRRRGPWAAVGGTALVAAAAAGGVLVYSAVSNTTPAYAVSRNSDGSVSVVLRRVDGIGGLNARLQSMGVKARAVLVADGCPPSRALVRASLHARGRVNWVARRQTVVRPASVSARRMQILLVRRSKNGRLALGAVTGRSAHAVPACVNQVRVAVRGQVLRGQAQLSPGNVVVRGTPPPIFIQRCGLRPPSAVAAAGGTATTATDTTGTDTTGSTGTATTPSTGTAPTASTGTVTTGGTGTATTDTTTSGGNAVSPAGPPPRWRHVAMQCVLRATGARTQMSSTGTATSPTPTNTTQTTTTP